MKDFESFTATRNPEDREFSKQKLALEERAQKLLESATEKMNKVSPQVLDENLRPRIPYPKPGDMQSPWRTYFDLENILTNLGYSFAQGEYVDKDGERTYEIEGGGLKGEMQREADGVEWDPYRQGMQDPLVKKLDNASSPEELAEIEQWLEKLEAVFAGLELES